MTSPTSRTGDATTQNIDPDQLLQPIISQTSTFTRSAGVKLMEKSGVVLQERIGSGTYSTVKKAWRRANSEHSSGWVAVKVIDRRKVREDFVRRFLPRELNIIKELQHPNIIQTFDMFDYNSTIVYIVEELAEQDLLQKVKVNTRIAEPEAKRVFRQVFEALHYLHDKMCMAHRDLKCENVLFDSLGNVKLCDFGFACYMKNGRVSKTFCGSRAYAAPEILTCTPYSGCSVDIWSAGVVLYVSLTGYMLYDDKNKEDMRQKQDNRIIKYPKNVSQLISADAKQLVFDLLQPEPSNRLGYLQIINSAWLKDVPWEYRKDNILYRMQNKPLPPTVDNSTAS